MKKNLDDYKSFIKKNCNYDTVSLRKVKMKNYELIRDVKIAGIVNKVKIIQTENTYYWAKVTIYDG